MVKGSRKYSVDTGLAGRLYAEGASLTELAERFHVSMASLRRYLIADGVQMRPAAQSVRLRGGYSHPPAVRARISAARKEALRHAPMPSTKGRTWDPEQRRKQMQIRRSAEFGRKMADQKRGAKSHFWRGGVSGEEDLRMHGRAWKQRRRECYQRDSWACQDCGVNCVNGARAKEHPRRKIQAHHVIPRRLGGTDELDNLVTLCASCHRSREYRFADALIA